MGRSLLQSLFLLQSGRTLYCKCVRSLLNASVISLLPFARESSKVGVLHYHSPKKTGHLLKLSFSGQHLSSPSLLENLRKSPATRPPPVATARVRGDRKLCSPDTADTHVTFARRSRLYQGKLSWCSKFELMDSFLKTCTEYTETLIFQPFTQIRAGISRTVEKPASTHAHRTLVSGDACIGVCSRVLCP